MEFTQDTDKARRITAHQPPKPMRERPIFVGSDWYDEIVRLTKEFVGDHMVAVLIDEVVARLYPERLALLQEELPRVRVHMIPAGEKSKSLTTVLQIQEFMLEEDLHRDDILICMGGGSICDIAAYVAATYIRGISLVSIPTTLIAMCDCAIGGKTQLNLGSHKSYTGLFYWPNVVLTDLSFLATLPDRQYRSAIPEIAKLGLIGNEKLFKQLCETCTTGEGHKCLTPRIEDYVVLTATQKSRIAASDPYQMGLRVVLLTGHTTSHALEAASNLKLLHGEAVAVGLAFESNISVKRGLMTAEDRKALIDLLESCQLPTTLPGELHDRRLLECMRLEKRNRGRDVNFILPYHPGKAVDDWPASKVQFNRDEVWQELAAYRQERG